MAAGWSGLLAWLYGWKHGPRTAAAGPYRAAAAGAFVSGAAAGKFFPGGAERGEVDAH